MLILTPNDFSLAAATPTSGLEWVRSSNGVLAVEHGTCAPSLLPADSDVVLMLPPRAVSWHQVTLPKVAAGRLRAALDGVLEDRLLNDPAELHFALEPGGRAGQTLWVAACNRSWLTAWLQVLEAAGRPVSRIVPAMWPTTAGGGRDETVHWAHDEGDRVWLASASPLGVRCIPLRDNGTSTFGASTHGNSSFGNSSFGNSTFGDSTFGGAGHAAQHLSTASDPDNTHWFADPAIAGLAEQVCNQHFNLMTRPAWQLRCAQSEWNLAQFDLSLSSGARRGQRLRQTLRQWRSAPAWRPARWGFVALLLSLVGGLNAMAWIDRSGLQDKRRAVSGVLQTTFPDVTVVLDAPAQMQRALTQLQQSGGALSTSDLEAMLAAVSMADPEAAVGSIDFTSGSARMGDWSVPADRLLALQQALNARGWRAELDGGSLHIRPKAP